MTAMTVRLPESTHDALRETAVRQGRSMQSVVVEAVERYVSDRARRRDEALAQIVAQDAAILDRLA